MPDFFFNPTPIVTPSEDKWSQPEATGDRWAWIQAENTQDIAWHIQHAFEENTAWYIQNADDHSIAWHIQNLFEEQIAWHIQHAYEANIKWHIFPELVSYYGPLFQINSTKFSFKPQEVLKYSHALEALTTTFQIIEELITDKSMAYKIITTFKAINPGTTFTVDSDVHTDKKIQPIEKGLVAPYE